MIKNLEPMKWTYQGHSLPETAIHKKVSKHTAHIAEPQAAWEME